jgi:AcrR family transcriptional regulator
MPPRSAVRATDRFERKREAILDAATSILNRLGVKGLTLGVAAAAVDLSTTSVTYYFRRKDDLAAAVMLRGIEAMQRMADTAVEAATPADRLHRLLTLYLDRMRQTALREAPPLPVLSELRALNDAHRKEVGQAFGRLFRRVRQIFDAPELEWMSRGRRTARTHLVLEQLFWSAVWLPKYDPEDYPRLRERMYEILVGGLAVEGAAWAPTAIPVG